MEFFKKQTLIDQLTSGSLDTKKFGQDLKTHMDKQEYRRTRFSEKLGIRYKDFIELLKSGNFDIDMVLQEQSEDQKGHLLFAIKRQDTDMYHQKYVVMVLNKMAPTMFPPEETIIDYVADRLRKNFEGN